jgi:hypothetical protein
MCHILRGAFHKQDIAMKFALVDGKREEAQPNASGKCAACGHSMIAKCGEVKVWHWAHKSAPPCDSWWEGETEWHRGWKEKFPAEWQEIAHVGKSGERHIADVKTAHGWAIEFQHSFLNPEERRSRDAFYQKLVWVVDGTRRKRDKLQFMSAWELGSMVGQNEQIRRVSSCSCAILKEWAGSNKPVFFDFGDEAALWWRFARGSNEMFYIAQVSRKVFVDLHIEGLKQVDRDAFGEVAAGLIARVSRYESESRSRSMTKFARSMRRPRARRPSRRL